MLQSLLKFIENSPDCFHAVENVRRCLEREGYLRLSSESWELVPGGRYYAVRNGSSLIAFRVPAEKPQGFVLSAAHTDSPCFKLREKPEINKGDYLRLELEGYGGMIRASWVDRPLSIAGRVMVRTAEGLESRLVDLKKDAALIPNVAVHLNRRINESLKYDPAEDLIALYAGNARSESFMQEIAEAADCRPEDIVSRELMLYNPQPGTVWGPEEEFLSAPRLDDLACVFACLEGFLSARETDRIPVLCLFDNEEIGSETRQGAASELLPRILKTLSEALFLSPAEHLALLDNSFMLSCDNGHAKHPNHPELSDRNEAPLLNGGVVIKQSPHYATDGVSAAVCAELAARAGIPVQYYANRPDIAGGGTLGKIAQTQTPVPMADIGIAQLAMHSAFETMGSRDLESMTDFIRTVYGSRICFEGDNIRL